MSSTEYQAISTNPGANEWDKALQATLAKKQDDRCCKMLRAAEKEKDAFTPLKATSVVLRVNDFTGLSQGDKLWIKGVHEVYLQLVEQSEELHAVSLQLDICFGVCAGCVPILIPFSQTYKDTVWTIFGGFVNVGTVISILAVLCSLLGTIAQVYSKASKVGQQCQDSTKEAGQIEDALNHFLAKAGEYEGLEDRQAFTLFVNKISKIRNMAYDTYCSFLPGQDMKPLEEKGKAAKESKGMPGSDA